MTHGHSLTTMAITMQMMANGEYNQSGLMIKIGGWRLS
jgi:hypothetical protein